LAMMAIVDLTECLVIDHDRMPPAVRLGHGQPRAADVARMS
jgi:hypothetical protein